MCEFEGRKAQINLFFFLAKKNSFPFSYIPFFSRILSCILDNIPFPFFPIYNLWSTLVNEQKLKKAKVDGDDDHEDDDDG